MQDIKRRSLDEYNSVLRKFRVSAEQIEAVGGCGVLYIKMAHVRRDRFASQVGCYEVDDGDDLDEHSNTVQEIPPAFSTKWDVELLVVDKDFARHFAHVMDEIKRRRGEDSTRRSSLAKEPPKARELLKVNEVPQPATTLLARPKTYEEYLTASGPSLPTVMTARSWVTRPTTATYVCTRRWLAWASFLHMSWRRASARSRGRGRLGRGAMRAARMAMAMARCVLVAETLRPMLGSWNASSR